jgi:hypothetical protein
MKHLPTIKEESNLYYFPMRDDDDQIEPKFLKTLKESMKKTYGDEKEPMYVKKRAKKNVK